MEGRSVSATRGSFVPSEGAIGVRLVRGRDRFEVYPELAAGAGLSRRLVVVQDSYAEGCGEMFFDEPLWAALVEFICRHAAKVTAEVTDRKGRFNESPIDAFLEEWKRTDPEDRAPPLAIVGREGGDVRLCMVLEAWFAVGGPGPYHDSYSYSLYTDHDLESELRACLGTAVGCERWTLAMDTIELRPDYFLSQSSWSYRLWRWVRSWFTKPSLAQGG